MRPYPCRCLGEAPQGSEELGEGYGKVCQENVDFNEQKKFFLSYYKFKRQFFSISNSIFFFFLVYFQVRKEFLISLIKNMED